MKRALKWILGSVLALLVAVLAILLWVDPNDFKPQLQQLAREQGQLDIQFDGELGWSLFPSIALSLPATQVRELDGEPLASLERAELAVQLLPLLGGELQMRGILVDGLRLSLTAKGPSEVEPEVDQVAAPAAPSMPLFNVGQIEIRNGQLRYTDPANDQQIQIDGLQLTLDQLVSDEPSKLSLALVLRSLALSQPEQAIQLDLALQSQLLLNSAGGTLDMNELELQLKAQLPALAKPAHIDLSADLRLDQPQGRIEVDGLKLKLAQLLVEAQLRVNDLNSEPAFTGTLAVAPFDLKQLLAQLGAAQVETQKDSALRSLALQSQLQGSVQSVALKQLVVQLDQSRFEGEFSYDLNLARPEVLLRGDRLLLDDYLPPANAAEAESQQQGGTGDASAASKGYSNEPLLPLELLGGLSFSADLALEQFSASGVDIDRLKLLAEGGAGKIELEQLSGNLYQGSFHNSAQLDLTVEPIRIEVKKQLDSVELGDALVALLELDSFSGRMSLKGDYLARGNSEQAIINSLSGQGQVLLKQGRLKGVDLGDKLCRGVLSMQGREAAPSEAKESYTEFSNLNGSFQIDRGVVATEDLKAALTGIGLKALGQIDLPAQQLDMGLDLTVLQDFASDNCRIDEKLHNLALPMRCQGGFDQDPLKLCRVDSDGMKRALKSAAKREGKALEEKAKQKLEQKLKDSDSLNDALKGLFK